MDRRKFVTTAGLAGTAGLLAACGSNSGTAECTETATGGSGETFEWKMVTTWPRDFPGLGTGANYLARIIGEMSGGRLTVKVYGGGELVPPLEVFDAVSRGVAEMGHGGAYYWKGVIPASPFFSTMRSRISARYFCRYSSLTMWRSSVSWKISPTRRLR